MKNAVGFIHSAVDRSDFIESLIKACKEYDIDIDCHFLDTRNLMNRFKILYRGNKNIATWGVKRKHQDYIYKGKNVLFFEYCLLKQSSGWFIDADGLYYDSRFSKQKLWENDITTDEYEKLHSYIKENLGFELFSYRKNDGPILVALQHGNDAILRYYYDNGRNTNLPIKYFLQQVAEYFKDKKVIVRPHPKYMQDWEKDEEEYLTTFGESWELQKTGSIYDMFKVCSSILTINSTVATEAVAYGIPVATFGKGVFTDAGVTLECANNVENVTNIDNFYIDKMTIIRYLVALLKHQIPRNPSVRDFLRNEDFVIWAKRCGE